jgi:hypothetical protein
VANLKEGRVGWTTVWTPAQVGVELTGELVLSVAELNHVLSHFPIPQAVVAHAGGLTGQMPVHFISPEHVRGVPITEASRVFALGSVLITMLTGDRAFAEDNQMATLLRIAEGRARWRATAHPECPPALAEALARAIRPAPGDRFESLPELRAALRDAAGVAPASADEVAGVFFGADPEGLRARFKALAERPDLLPEGWRGGGLAVLEDRALERLVPWGDLPAVARPLARASPMRLNLASAARTQWWRRLWPFT